MSEKNVYAIPNVPTPNAPVIFNPDVCTGCNNCVETCPVDIFIPNPEKGASPIILHAEECWYCGCCADDCPVPGAMEFNWALPMKPRWKNKESGEVHQLL